MQQETLALATLQDALAIDRNIAVVYIERGNIHKSGSRYEDALKQYKLATLISPDDWQGYYKQGVVLYYLSRMEEAKEALTKANEISLDNGTVFHFRGLVALAENDLKTAEEMLRKASEHDSKNADVWFHYGQTYMRLEQYEAAKIHLLKSVELDPNNSETLYNLGQVYKKLSQHATSREYLRKFKNISDIEERSEVLSTQIRMHPENSSLRLQLAELYEQNGQLDRALMVYRQAAYIGNAEADNKIENLLSKINQ